MNDQALITLRRKLHQMAEPGWLEMATTVFLIDYLLDLGFEVQYGRAIHGPEQMGRPDPTVIEAHAAGLAVTREYDISDILAGYTGLIARWDTGRPGKTYGLRFDIDANEVPESDDPAHRPAAEGFASRNHGAMHACGHDGHMTIGLGLAEWIAQADDLTGRYVLIFQPAEEGVRGAKSMVESGQLAGIDVFLSGHIGLGTPSGILGVGTVGFYATSKLDITFSGVPAHAGAKPEDGRNALLGACSFSLQAHSLPQFSSGISRINVGTLQAGTGRNVVPAQAKLTIETRGEVSAINQAIKERLIAMAEGTALSFGLSHSVQEVGGAPAWTEDSAPVIPELFDYLSQAGFDIKKSPRLGGSEDVTYMMQDVLDNGGQVVHFIFGADLSAGHHNDRFDFDEDVLEMALRALQAGLRFFGA